MSKRSDKRSTRQTASANVDDTTSENAEDTEPTRISELETLLQEQQRQLQAIAQ